MKYSETQTSCCQRQLLGYRARNTIVHREDTEKEDASTACWMLATQPSDIINTESVEIQVAFELSLEGNIKGGVHRAKHFTFKHRL